MKIKTKALKEALQHLGRIVSTRNSLPILSSMLFEAKHNTLTLSASNLDEHIIERVECEGDIAVCCPGFSQLLCGIGGEEMEITQEPNTLTLVFPGSHFELKTQAAEEFPALPTGKFIAAGVSCAELAKGVRAVAWAASTDPGRWVLQAAHIIAKARALTCEATTGPQLAIWESALIGSEFECILPSAFTSNACVALERPEAQFALSDNCISVNHASGSYFCKQAEGVFPKTKQAIPPAETPVGTLKVLEMLDVVNRCKLFADGKSESFKVITSKSNLAAKYISENGNLDFEILGKFLPRTFAIGVKNMSRCFEAFKAIGADDVTMENKDELSPVVIRAGDLSVITMPYRMS